MDSGGTLFLQGHPFGLISSERVQQLLPRFRDQAHSRGNSNVGDHVRSIFQTQAVFDQAVHARLSNHVLKNLLVFFYPQPIAEFGQQRVVGQRALQAQIQKIAKGHVETRLLHDALVCEVILILQEFQLQRSEEHTSELQSHSDLVCRLLLEKKKKKKKK